MFYSSYLLTHKVKYITSEQPAQVNIYKDTHSQKFFNLTCNLTRAFIQVNA